MAIVLIPGFMLSRDLWADIERALIPFGPLIHSDPGAGDSIETMARVTLQSAPSRFALMGFSMGGYVARSIVRMAPDRVSRLVLVATSSRGDEASQAKRKLDASNRSAARFGGVSRTAIRKSLAPGRENDAAVVERIHAMSVDVGGATYRKQASLQRDGDTPLLSDIKCPTLIVAGRDDRLRSLEEARELQAGIAGSKLVILECGHMIPLEAPGELADLLLAFLQ